MKTMTKLGQAVIIFMVSLQIAQAQTKKETIKWVKDNLEKHGGVLGIVNTSYINISVSPCQISFIEIDNDMDESVYKYSFNPSDVKGWTFGEDAYIGLYISADRRIILQNTISDDRNAYTTDITFREGMSDIHTRMIKALLHLATFCKKKNESF